MTSGSPNDAPTLPESMTCIEIPEPGPEPTALKAGTRPVPVPGNGEVLIKVAAAGVNRPDLMQRRGKYPPPPGITDIPGLEVAGTVVACGERAMDVEVGDAVTALVAGGGYAEYCVAPAPQTLPVPKGLGLVEAAALPETFFTVWSNLYDRARLQPGETVLVHGGSSGIGTTAIMLAHNLGSRVIATAGSADKCRACTELGADLAINYKEQDFVAETMAFTGGKGVNVVLDMVAGDYVPRDMECMAEDARLCLIATLGGIKAEVNLLSIMLKRLTLTGSTLRTRPIGFKGVIAASLKERVWPLIEAGDVKPVIHATVPLTDAAKAHEILETGDHIGKVVLTV